MAIKDIKANVLKLIDEFDDETALIHLYEILNDFKQQHSKGGTDWWDKLTQEEKQDLLLGLEEVKDQRNLVTHEETMKGARKWLKK